MVSPSTNQGIFCTPHPWPAASFMARSKRVLVFQIEPAARGKLPAAVAVVAKPREAGCPRRQQDNCTLWRNAPGQFHGCCKIRRLVHSFGRSNAGVTQAGQNARPAIGHRYDRQRGCRGKRLHIWGPVKSPVKAANNQGYALPRERLQRGDRRHGGRGDAVIDEAQAGTLTEQLQAVRQWSKRNQRIKRSFRFDPDDARRRQRRGRIGQIVRPG